MILEAYPMIFINANLNVQTNYCCQIVQYLPPVTEGTKYSYPRTVLCTVSFSFLQ